MNEPLPKVEEVVVIEEVKESISMWRCPCCLSKQLFDIKCKKGTDVGKYMDRNDFFEKFVYAEEVIRVVSNGSDKE